MSIKLLWMAIMSAARAVIEWFELDYMEYADDATAQAAYVSDGLAVYGSNFITGGTPSADNEYDDGYRAPQACDGNTGTYWSSGNYPFPHWWKYDLGVGVTKTARKLVLNLVNKTHLKNFKLQGSNNDSDWNDIYTGIHNNTDTEQTFTFENSTAYRYYRLYSTDNWDSNNWTSISEIYLYEITTEQSLQCYSESTIKTQGSYSLKVIAAITSSLNKTLTRTISPADDLSNKTQIKYDVRASRTGSNFKLGWHDSGGNWIESTPNILEADEFQEVTVDISAVADADKDVIDTAKLTILNADAENVIYIDNVRYA